MKLPKRFTPEPTSYLKVGNGTVPIQILPQDLASEFGMLDKMQQDFSDRLYQLEILQLAISKKKEELTLKAVRVLEELTTQSEPSKQEVDK